MQKKSRHTLWTKDFTLITLGTVISAIGGVAMNLALSLVVFDQTESTLMSGIFAAVSLLPGTVLPILIAPYIDRCDRKKMIVALDYTSGILYLLFYLFLIQHPFSYPAYLCFSFLTGCIGSVYSLAYQAFYPDLIAEGMAQKGYSVSSFIYPTATALITPLASLLYTRWGIGCIILGEGVLLLIAASFEVFIHNPRQPQPGPREDKPLSARLKDYGREILDGFRYVKREKGIRSIYLYMTATNATSQGTSLMIMAHFQSASGLSTAMYSLLISAETIGRTVGSVLHYLIKIPAKRRYSLTRTVYQIYEICDGLLLFLAYPLMIILKFLCGFLGVNTATLREAAVQNYLPPNIRARINALFSVLVSLGLMAVQVLTGALGEWLPYPYVPLLFAGFSFLLIFLLIVRNRREVEAIYNQDF